MIRLVNTRLVLYVSYISAKHVPLQASRPYPLLVRPARQEPTDAANTLSVPPSELWSGWGPTAADYVETGRADIDAMSRVLGTAGFDMSAAGRVLDFGCGAGRMIRHYPRLPETEVWGVDIAADAIAWCQLHLSPPLHFATITTAPHLPFEDGYFDLVYANSVFTHIGDLADAWFLELRRILRPAGCLYVTIHDKASIRLLLGELADEPDHAFVVNQLRGIQQRTSALSKDFVYLGLLVDPGINVFYDADYLVDKWSRLSRCLARTEQATGYQTALVFQKFDPPVEARVGSAARGAEQRRN